jgi:flagellar protein FliS
MIQTHQNKYLEASVQSATPAQLLIMLCDGAIRFCKQGIKSIEEKKYEEANRNICRVQDIVSEFVITLDTSSPIAEGLVLLYDYFIFRLIEANTTKTKEPIEEVMNMFVDLKNTWFEANKQIISTPKNPAGIK